MTSPPQAVSALDLLRSYSHVALQQMGRRNGMVVNGKSKASLLAPLAKSLYDKERVMAALEDLEPVERDALDGVILAGGVLLTSVLRQQLEGQGKIEPRSRDRLHYQHVDNRGSHTRRGSTRLEDIIARLGVLGLAFTMNPGGYNRNVDFSQPGQYVFIPEAILQHLPAATLTLEIANPPEVEIAADSDAFLRDLYVLSSFAIAEPIPLTVKGLIPKRTLVQIDESFHEPEGADRVRSEADLGRLSILRSLAEQLQLLRTSPSGLILGDAGEKFLSKPRGERQRLLFDAYRSTQFWTELSRLPDMTFSPRERMIGPIIVAGRKRVLTEMAELPAGAWIPVSHLVDRLRQRAFEFLFSRDMGSNVYYYFGGSYYSEVTPYGGHNALGLRLQLKSGESPDWETVEAAFIRTLVTEVLYWFGMVDLGSARGGSPSVFRITEGGATLLRGGTPRSAQGESRVVIQPNFQVFAFEPTGEDVLFTLDRMAKRVRVERVVEYVLTRDSVYGAQSYGMTTGGILEFLERVSSTPLPQNVRRSLEEWGEQFERIAIRRDTSIVHAHSSATLDALYADSTLAPLLGRRIAPIAALVPAEHLTMISAHLTAHASHRGHPLPALSEGDDSWFNPTIVASDDGCITFRHGVPSMYVQAAIRSFADEGGDGTMRLTRHSLQRGARASLTSEDVIATLEQFHLGPLPDTVRTLVRRWTKHWGHVTLTEVALLQVESAEIITELLADEELKRYLQALPGAQTLASVRSEHIETVRHLLQNRGIDL